MPSVRLYAMVAMILTVTCASTSSARAHQEVTYPREAVEANVVPPVNAVRELIDQRTATSRTYATASGIHVAKLFTRPIHYRARDGRWLSIDNAAVPTLAGGFDNAANSFDVDLPADLDAGAVRLTDGKRWMSFSLRGARGRATARGSKVRYAGALPSVSVEYAIESTGLKEALVLKNRRAARRFVFDVRLAPGLRMIETRSGGAVVVDVRGKKRFAIAPPMGWDGAAGSIPDRALSMRVAEAGRQLVLAVSDSYLDHPDRQFPVTVDPWVQVKPPSADCTLSALGSESSTSFCSATDLHAGTVDGHNHHALLAFNVPGRVPLGSTVLEAYAATYVRERANTNFEMWAMHRVTRSWTNGEASWSRASSSTPWATAGGDYDPQPAIEKGQHTGGAWSYWPMPQLVQDWISGRQPDYGVLLKSPTSPARNGLIINSGEHTGSRPSLTVWYIPPVGVGRGYSFVTPELAATSAPADYSDWEDLDGVNVNVASGGLLLRASDGEVTPESSAEDLSLERFYNSRSGESGAFGSGWSDGLGRNTELRLMGDEAVIFMAPSGQPYRFSKNVDGSYSGPFGLPATLTRLSDGRAQVIYESGERYEFPDLNSPVSAYEDEGGSRVTLSYRPGSEDRALEAIHSSGGTTTFTNSAGTQRVATISSPAGATYRYTYEGSRLKTVEVPGSRLWTYGYDGSGRLTSVTAPGGEKTVVAYVDQHPTDRVAALTRVLDPATGSGQRTTFSYSEPTSPCSTTRHSGQTSVTDPTGQVRRYCWDRDMVVRDAFRGNSPPALGLSGDLTPYDGRVIPRGAGYGLTVTGNDSDGVAKIEVEIDGENGDERDSAKACSATTCTFDWAFSPDNYDGGLLSVTARVTDTAGNESARSLIVSIPLGAPLPEAVEQPESQTSRLAHARRFRAEFGMRADDAYLLQLDSDPAARTAERDYGIPMTFEERADIDARRASHDKTQIIRDYVADANVAATFSGMFIRQQEGGLIYVGFTSNAQQRLQELRAVFPDPDRLRAFTGVYTEAQLAATKDQIIVDRAALAADGVTVRNVTVRFDGNVVEVGVPTADAATQAKLTARYGSAVTAVVADVGEDRKTRTSSWLSLRAGIEINSTCTLGGTARIRFDNGTFGWRLLTAGHCVFGQDYVRQPGGTSGRRFEITHNSTPQNNGTTESDIAIGRIRKLNTSRSIYESQTFARFITSTAGANSSDVEEGKEFCVSGKVSGVKCGPIESTDYYHNLAEYNLDNALRFSIHTQGGDSGAPVYQKLKGGRARFIGIHHGHTFDILNRRDAIASDIAVWKRNLARRPGVKAVEICRRGICRR